MSHFNNWEKQEVFFQTIVYETMFKLNFIPEWDSACFILVQVSMKSHFSYMWTHSWLNWKREKSQETEIAKQLVKKCEWDIINYVEMF